MLGIYSYSVSILESYHFNLLKCSWYKGKVCQCNIKNYLESHKDVVKQEKNVISQFCSRHMSAFSEFFNIFATSYCHNRHLTDILDSAFSLFWLRELGHFTQSWLYAKCYFGNVGNALLVCIIVPLRYTAKRRNVPNLNNTGVQALRNRLANGDSAFLICLSNVITTSIAGSQML